MIFLALETSCDETSVALIEGRKIVFHDVYSQVSHHRKYKGVVPEVASRIHSSVISSLIKKAGIKRVDVVGFTRGPGLKGSLIVGKIAAMTVAEYYSADIVGINHLEGHLLACDITDGIIEDRLRFPLICLVVSGGHSELWYSSGYGRYKRIGRTRDDACGEAFDKVARLLGLDYPGGPEIERWALKSLNSQISFTVPDVADSFDYSFSGIKTQVMYYIRDLKKITSKIKADVAFAFQKAVSQSLVNKLDIAVKKFGVKNIAVVGGVSANGYLRRLVEEKFKGCRIYFPQLKYTSDNAAMIGACLVRRYEKKRFKNTTEIDDKLEIGDW